MRTNGWNIVTFSVVYCGYADVMVFHARTNDVIISMYRHTNLDSTS